MLEKIAADIRKTLESQTFAGSLKFDCGDDGVIVLADGTAVKQDQETDCTLQLSTENLQALLKSICPASLL